MEIIAKLLAVHLLVDFVLQSDSWVRHKEKNKLKSAWLYVHAALHGLLSWLVLWKIEYWWVALSIGSSHLIIDALKIILSDKRNHRWLFLIDQILHMAILVGLTLTINPINFIVSEDTIRLFWPFIACVLLLTSPVAIGLKVFFTRWKLTEKKTGIYGLRNAGRWIGIIERLLIFIFVVTDNFSAVGFLLTAKSVFRFGDLSKAKNMKLTEYVLIGTLLSFGIAILTGLLFNSMV